MSDAREQARELMRAARPESTLMPSIETLTAAADALELLAAAKRTEINSCSNCTFCVWLDEGELPTCRRKGRKISDAEYYSGGIPPNWCPLRSGGILVTLRVK